MKKELRILNETIMYLINVSDTLESFRKQYDDVSGNKLHQGQEHLCYAIQDFKNALERLKKQERQELIRNEEKDN